MCSPMPDLDWTPCPAINPDDPEILCSGTLGHVGDHEGFIPVAWPQ